MTEPAMTPKQLDILRRYFANRMSFPCYCAAQDVDICNRCLDIAEIKEHFPASYVAACMRVVEGKRG